MAEAKKTKVQVIRPIWIEGKDGNPEKLEAGSVVELTDEQIKHYGKTAVTRDVD